MHHKIYDIFIYRYNSSRTQGLLYLYIFIYRYNKPCVRLLFEFNARHTDFHAARRRSQCKHNISMSNKLR